MSENPKYYVVTSVFFGCAASSHYSEMKVFKAEDENSVLKYCVRNQIDVVFLRETSIDVWNCADGRARVSL